MFDIWIIEIPTWNLWWKSENKPEEIIKLEEKLSSILDKLKIPKSEANSNYVGGLISKWDNIFSKAVYEAVNEKSIAVNHIIKFIEDYYKVDSLIEDIENDEFLSENEKYAIKKFLRKEIIWELKISSLENKGVLSVVSDISGKPTLSNENKEFILRFDGFFNLFLKMKEMWAEPEITFES